jgi:hypothetical protein
LIYKPKKIRLQAQIAKNANCANLGLKKGNDKKIQVGEGGAVKS